jgi:hypothetical protein
LTVAVPLLPANCGDTMYVDPSAGASTHGASTASTVVTSFGFSVMVDPEHWSDVVEEGELLQAAAAREVTIAANEKNLMDPVVSRERLERMLAVVGTLPF